MSLAKLREMSNRYGKNPEYVLAGGGNTSFKDDEFLYIKGSGTSLATIEENGFVKLSRRKLDLIFEKSYPADADAREAAVLADMMGARVPGELKRPSVETLLHQVYPVSFVLHLHPAFVNGLTCASGGRAAFDRLFEKDGIWIEPIMPGYILGVRVKEEIDAFKKTHGVLPTYLFIENHGVFVGADTVEEIDALMAELTGRLVLELTEKPDFSPADFDREKAAAIAPAVRMLTSGDKPGICVFNTNTEVLHFAGSAGDFAKIHTAFTPDHMVYCHTATLFIEAEETEQIYAELEEKISAYKAQYGFAPKIIGVKGLGYYACGSTKKEADIAAGIFKDAIKVAVFARNFGGGRPMPEKLVSSIANWEVERYRQSVSFTGSAPKRLEGKISIVTGSAQGFGQGIAENMAGDGAYLGIADMNGEGAAQNAAALNAKYGDGTAVSMAVNVADEAGVKAMVEEMVLHYGGLDIFVNNAGIVRAGSLEEMTLANFELTTKINYTAYFVCVKYVSLVMKLQNRFNKKIYMDIIQINSKSGLVGSNKNFAYAGGKFGGIGLTQSFALELTPFNIKVNSVCPGNFLDGPLWCDPKRGLFVQYLHAGKVPGAKTVEDVKRFYEAKVPMNRGCQIRDVSRAINYVVEQEYETGQAIPVTGGQVMLS